MQQQRLSLPKEMGPELQNNCATTQLLKIIQKYPK